ncbi:hypothetical protein ACJX0J_016216, partial [Zea mays]
QFSKLILYLILCSSKSSIVYLHVSNYLCLGFCIANDDKIKACFSTFAGAFFLINLYHNISNDFWNLAELYAIVFVDFVTQVYRLYCVNYLIIGTGASLPFPLVSILDVLLTHVKFCSTKSVSVKKRITFPIMNVACMWPSKILKFKCFYFILISKRFNHQ